MELPHLSGPLAADGGKATHDFLSLYSNSPVQQDPRSPSHGGEYLKTHNFLQPLEKEDESNLEQDKAGGINIEKRPPSAPPSIEKVLPGGTAYVSHAPYFNPWMAKSRGTAFNLEVSDDVRNDENSNCSSYTAGSSFTLWEGSSAGKGKTGKAGSSDLDLAKDAMLRTGQWPIEWPSESSANHPKIFSSCSSSQPPAKINQSFVQMLKSTKLPAKEEIEDEAFAQREEGSSQRGESRTGFDGRAVNDQKPSTPRSKHSATEQRRRCKINDRFHMLREIIPRSNQKRDKASFLLEVIEYIQFLQEKVSRYEGYPGSSSETANLTPWKSSPKLSECSADQAHVVDAPVSAFKPDDKSNVFASSAQRNQQNPAEPRIRNPTPLKAIDQQPSLTYEAASFPISHPKADMYPSIRTEGAPTQPTCRLPAPNTDNAPLQQLQLSQNRDFNSTMINQKLAVEGSAISISSMYSQGLMSTLTQALKSFGVDVSQTNISVQVDIGKRTKPAQAAQKSYKDFDINHDSRALFHEREESDFLEESHHTTKKRKTLES